MNNRQLSIIAGVSYLIIFVTAIYANFFVLDALRSDPLGTVANAGTHVRVGAIAFLVAAVADTIVAWALYRMYSSDPFSSLSTYFRVIHAVIMGVAVYALVEIPALDVASEISGQVTVFNNMWLIGLFFFGFHLILLGRIVRHIKFIPYVMMLAGVKYILDTIAHFVMPNYAAYADVFLMLVAVPSILGEMAFSIWLLVKGGKENTK